MPRRIGYAGPAAGSTPRPSRHREYDRFSRDPESKRFYRSAAWLRVRELKRRRSPLCEVCLQSKPRRLVVGTVVHHVIERSKAPGVALDLDNLQTLCASCHSRHHASR